MDADAATEEEQHYEVAEWGMLCFTTLDGAAQSLQGSTGPWRELDVAAVSQLLTGHVADSTASFLGDFPPDAALGAAALLYADPEGAAAALSPALHRVLVRAAKGLLGPGDTLRDKHMQQGLLLVSFVSSQVLMLVEAASEKGDAGGSRASPFNPQLQLAAMKALGACSQTLHDTLQADLLTSDSLADVHGAHAQVVCLVAAKHTAVQATVKLQPRAKEHAAQMQEQLIGCCSKLASYCTPQSPTDPADTSADEAAQCAWSFLAMLAQQLCDVCRSTSSAVGPVTKLLTDILVGIRQPEQAIDLMLALADSAAQASGSTASMAHAAKAAASSASDTDPVLLAVISAALHMQNPVVAGYVLHCSLPHLQLPQKASRKTALALIDLAGLVITGPRPPALFAAQILHRGSLDKDANLRARTLAVLADSLDLLFTADLERQGCTDGPDSHSTVINSTDATEGSTAGKPCEEAGVGASNPPESGSMVLAHVCSILCPRLLDTTKTVRSKALALLLEIMTFEAPEAAALTAFPGICAILDAPPASPLYDEGCSQLAESALRLVLSSMGDEAVLRHLLSLLGSARSKPASDAGAKDLGTLGSSALSNAIIIRLLRHLQPSVRVAYAAWSDRLRELETAEQIIALSPFARATQQCQLLQQEAFRALCMAMASVPAGDALPSRTAAHLTAAMKVAFCFGSTGSKELLSEVAVVLDVATRMVTTGIPSAANPKGLPAAQQGLIWCFRLLHRMLSQQRALDLEAAAAPPPLVASNSGAQPTVPANNVQSDEAATVKGATLVLRFLQRVQPELLRHGSLVCIGSALQLLCACPGSSAPAHRLMRSLETQLSLAPNGSSAQVQLVPQSSTILQHGSDRLLAVYLTLLGHMASLYEAEDQEFTTRLRAAAAGTAGTGASRGGDEAVRGSGGAAGPRPDLDAGVGQFPGSAAAVTGTAGGQQGDGCTEGELQETACVMDYMQKDEAARSMRALAQQFMEGLMSHTAPACRTNILVMVLECPPGSLPAGIQVLALRALGRLMRLSDVMAEKFGPLLSRLLSAATSPAAREDDSSAAAGSGGCGEDPQCRQQRVAWEAAELVAAAALQVMEALISSSPNVNAPLLDSIQNLVKRLDHCQGQDQQQQQHQDELPKEDAQEHAPSEWPGHQLLVMALTTCARILSSERLHVQPEGWALFGHLASSSHVSPQVRAITLQLLRSLLGAPGFTPGVATPAVRMRRVRGAMSLFGSCPEAQRLALVDEVLLGEEFLDDTDLASDALVLPVVNALGVAASLVARQACGALLSRCFPSAKALKVLGETVQAMGIEHSMPTVEAKELLANLRECVQHHGSSTALDTSSKAPAAAGGEDAEEGAAGQLDAADVVKRGPGEKKAGAKDMQRLVLEVLDSLEAKLKVPKRPRQYTARQTARRRSSVSAAGARLMDEGGNEGGKEDPPSSGAEEMPGADDQQQLQEYQQMLHRFKQGGGEAAAHVLAQAGTVRTPLGMIQGGQVQGQQRSAAGLAAGQAGQPGKTESVRETDSAVQRGAPRMSSHVSRVKHKKPFRSGAPAAAKQMKRLRSHKSST